MCGGEPFGKDFGPRESALAAIMDPAWMTLARRPAAPEFGVNQGSARRAALGPRPRGPRGGAVASALPVREAWSCSAAGAPSSFAAAAICAASLGVGRLAACLNALPTVC